MSKMHLPNIDNNQIDGFRIFFIEYYIFSLYVTFENDDVGTGSYKVKINLLVLFTSIIIAISSMFSNYVFDINQLISDNWPFRLDVFKSPFNPKVAPAVVASAVAIIPIWKLWKKRNILLIVQHYKNEGFKSQGWILLFLTIFFTGASVLFSKEHSLLATGILLILFAYIHISGRLSKSKG